MLKRRSAFAVLVCCISAISAGQSQPVASAPKAQPAGAAAKAKTDLAAAVARMARVGSANSPSFSPDGKWVSFISNISGTPQVWVVPTEGGYPRMVTSGDDPVVEAEWSPASDWIGIAIAPGGGLNTQVYVIKPDGTGMRLLTKGGEDNNGLDAWTEDGKQIAIDSSRDDPASRDSFMIDLATGNARLVARNPGVGNIEGISRDGKRALLGRVRSRGDNNLYLLDVLSGKDTLITKHEGVALFSGDIAPDGGSAYIVTNKDRDLFAFGRIKLAADGAPGNIDVLAERQDGELDGIRINKRGTMAALLWNVKGRSELSFYDLAQNKQIPGPKLPGELVGGGVFSKDGSKLALAVAGAAQPTDIWIMDVKTKQFRQLTFSPHAGIDLAALVRPELVTFKSFDGLELSGWLYKPKNQNEPGPYVISFHGGPEGQERAPFRGDYQALLAQGIGVFAPNVRGSSGFGKKFVNLDNGELRVNGVKDIKACVDYLVNNHIAGPKRIGITGGSYGGYMTMAGLTEYPDSFAAGVDLFGIVNFMTFFQHTQPWMAAISKVEYGDPDTQKDMLDKLSPIYKLDRIKAATMVQHGANDTNVPVIEAEQIVKTLKDRGVTVEYILFPDEGHGWRKVPNRIKSTVEMVRFFSEHLQPN
ncbi:MAG TPA: S9 family peptidase [Candidatus Angelobacter sp.]|nr:S9 family peptidase [Candidatus Angelobacter sp.]